MFSLISRTPTYLTRTFSGKARGTSYLIIDGYLCASREELNAGGASTAGDLYDRMLRRVTPGPVETKITYPADPGWVVPSAEEILSYDGIAWTGCSLTIHNKSDEKVTKQIEFAKTIYDFGVPSFGSCWALQIAIAAAGGSCAVNPRGREMGIGRKLVLNADGRAHPMFEGKKGVFDAFMSHEDEATHLPSNALILASNGHSAVQAATVRHSKGEFWSVQYHPEYDLQELARLTHCRKAKLTGMGFFRSLDDAARYVEELQELHDSVLQGGSAKRRDLAWKLGIDDDVLNPDIRTAEVRNWVKYQVQPYRREKLEFPAKKH